MLPALAGLRKSIHFFSKAVCMRNGNIVEIAPAQVSARDPWVRTRGVYLLSRLGNMCLLFAQPHLLCGGQVPL